MNQDKERLNVMLKEHKISEADYKVLIEAIDKKSFLKRVSSSVLINPFQKIAGTKALFLGVAIFMLISFLGTIAQVYFIGVMGVLNAHVVTKQTADISFWLLLYQNAVSWIVLSSVFMIMTKLTQKKKVRVIDFLGTVAFARFPLLFLTALMSAIQILNPDFLAIDISQGIQLKTGLSMNLLGAVILCLFIYQITVYFHALKESSGLVGKKLWLGFITSFVIAEIVLQPLSTLFMS